MSRIIFLTLPRVFLAAIFVFGSVITHAGSVAHAGSSDTHEIVSHAEATPGSVDFTDTDKSDPSHALGFCIDAHCCTPAVHTAAQDAQRHSLESGKLVFGLASNYALSLPLSLLRPPRAIT